MSNKFAQLLLAATLLSAAALAQAAPNSSGRNQIGIINMQTAIIATNEGQRDFEALGKSSKPKAYRAQGPERRDR